MPETQLFVIIIIIMIYCYFLAHQHKAAGKKIRSKNNDHDGVSHGVECSQKSDRIPPLKSNR